MQHQLKKVQSIYSTPYGAFAAILEDKSVVTWGDENFGADISEVRDQLRDLAASWQNINQRKFLLQWFFH